MLIKISSCACFLVVSCSVVLAEPMEVTRVSILVIQKIQLNLNVAYTILYVTLCTPHFPTSTYFNPFHYAIAKRLSLGHTM